MLIRLGAIGEVIHLAKSGRVILKLYGSSHQVKTGEVLVDENGRRVGKVIEMLGPVASAYASVSPLTDRANRLVGTKMFSSGMFSHRIDSDTKRKNPMRSSNRMRSRSFKKR